MTKIKLPVWLKMFNPILYCLYFPVPLVAWPDLTSLFTAGQNLSQNRGKSSDFARNLPYCPDPRKEHLKVHHNFDNLNLRMPKENAGLFEVLLLNYKAIKSALLKSDHPSTDFLKDKHFHKY